MALVPINQVKYIQMIEESTEKIVRLKTYLPVPNENINYGFITSTVPDGFINVSNITGGEENAVWYRFADPSLYHFRLKIFLTGGDNIQCHLYNDDIFVTNLSASSASGSILTINDIKYGGIGIILVENKHYICGTMLKLQHGILNGIVYPFANLPENMALEKWFGDRKLIEIGYPGSPSNGGGGGGSFTTPHDPIKPPTETPDIGELYATRLCKAYVVNNENLIKFANSLWTNATEIGEYLRKLISNPMDAIIHLFAVPYNVNSVGSTNIIIGGYSTGAQGGILANGFSKLDCGTIKIEEYWGNSLDYTNTKMNIFLPFIGEIPLGKNCIGAEINVSYHIENSSGNFICFVSCYKNGNYWIESKHSGNCAIEIPLTAQDFHYLENVFSSAGNMMGLVTNSIIGNYGGVASNSMGLISQAINMGKGEIKSTGSYKGNIGALDNLLPYITIYKAVWQEPEDYTKFNGYPSNITAQLSELKGYTEVDKIHLDGISCTEAERKEIEDLLKSGVIL